MTDIADRLDALCKPDRRRKDRATARRTKETVPCELLVAAAREIRELRQALSVIAGGFAPAAEIAQEALSEQQGGAP